MITPGIIISLLISIAVLVLLTDYSVKRLKYWKILLIGYLLALVVPFTTYMANIGTPAPSWLRQIDEGQVVAYTFLEEEAIFIWIIPEGKNIPVSLILPWSTSQANNLIDAQEQAQKEGTGMFLRKNSNGEWNEWDKPVEALPSK
jgi:hypothetical protein